MKCLDTSRPCGWPLATMPRTLASDSMRFSAAKVSHDWRVSKLALCRLLQGPCGFLAVVTRVHKVANRKRITRVNCTTVLEQEIHTCFVWFHIVLLYRKNALKTFVVFYPSFASVCLMVGRVSSWLVTIMFLGFGATVQ